jgi:release factor glutamine methyltransferase
MSETWTVRRVLSWTAQHFEKKDIDAPRLTAEVLLAHTLKVDRVRLYVDLDRPLDKAELTAYRALLERRTKGEPTQYLTGKREFYNRSFVVDARVLIPRPETELLVEAVLRHAPKELPLRMLDVCTGSGCIAVSLAAERPLASVVATDLSKEACLVAQENASRLSVSDRVEVRQGDLFSPLRPDERFDVVVSNPPYIASAEIDSLSAEVRQEPRPALDGGPGGLDLLFAVVDGAKGWLKPGGLLALEMGETQGAAVLERLVGAGYESARVERDLERRDRMAFGTHRGG